VELEMQVDVPHLLLVLFQVVQEFVDKVMLEETVKAPLLMDLIMIEVHQVVEAELELLVVMVRVLFVQQVMVVQEHQVQYQVLLMLVVAEVEVLLVVVLELSEQFVQDQEVLVVEVQENQVHQVDVKLDQLGLLIQAVAVAVVLIDFLMVLDVVLVEQEEVVSLK
jgi:hypothetical protein